jgi:hypothetical protein
MSDLKLRAVQFLAEQWSLTPVSCTAAADKVAIFKSMTSGRWRRSALDEESRFDLEGKIAAALSSGVPIEFSVPFGGYKSWTMASYPHLNWADVFAVNYLRRFGEDVVREGGWRVAIVFSYCSGVMDIVNNMRLEEQEVYTAEFSALLELFSDDYVEMSLFDVASLFPSRERLRSTILLSADSVAKQWQGLGAEVREKRLRSANRNLQRDGFEDLSSVSDDELHNKIEQSAIFCEALDSLPERRTFNKYSSRIQLVNVRGPKPSIHVASCDTSSNHFGVGDGLVEVRGGRCLQRIVTGIMPPAAENLAIEREHALTRGFVGLQNMQFIDSTALR